MNAEEAAPFPTPQVDDINRPYWDALRRGELHYMSCTECAHNWLPARSECPNCLGPNTEWKKASGDAHLISWVTYHKAFNPAFRDRVPYNVSVIELSEGPRLISRVVDLEDPEDLEIDQQLKLDIQQEHGFSIPVFKKVL